MSIMELGALGEFVGSFLVLGTLVYLAVQVRQNTKMMRTNMRQATAQANIEGTKILVDPHVAAVVSPLAVAESGFPGPGTPESSVVYGYVMVQLHGFESQHVQVEHGLLEEDTLHRRMSIWSSVPLHRHMWREWQLGNWFSVEFAKEMNGFVSNAEGESQNYGVAVDAGQDVFGGGTDGDAT